MGLLDRIREERQEQSKPKNVAGNGRKKSISGTSQGKWETSTALADYRRARNKARKVAKKSRRRG
jgi:hypothetical protein